MKKVFVFCVGGTGLRVMKSITMLMASGMDTNGYSVIPILVDPHQDLEEKKNLQSLIDVYRDIYDRSINDGEQTLNPGNGFFPAKIDWLGSLDDNKNDVNENIGVDKSFESYLGLEKLANNDTNNYLVDILFSTKNKRNKLSVGFKGNPNVGTVVLGDMIEGSSWFESFKRHCEKEDRVFIISSIFGGTGASGFPLIEKKIKESDDEPTVKNAVLGSVIVMPYYGLKDPSTSHSDIDSANFYTKTKAALSYYDGKIESKYVYYVGETTLRKIYENNEAEQKDTANFIELVAASALFDFLKRDKPNQTQYMSRAIEDDAESLDKDKLGSGYNGIVKVVADFNLFIKLASILPTEKYFPLKQTRGFDKNFYQDQAFTSLRKFIGIYDQWYNELATNNRAFAPLNTGNNNLSGFVKGITLGGADDSYYLLEMIKASNKDKKDKHANKFRYFLDFAHQAIDYYTEKIQK
mgnify:CR=1 FL=1